jgi:RimJ/RimL family protein N-acetyltransferase
VNVEPLFAIRLRTPQLELRLPTDDELDQLREVALAGIHPPESMPFAVAWTDEPELASFVSFHRSLRRGWSPDSWDLELAVWVDGRPAGSQGLVGEDFARSRTVRTGSWLGADFQRRGYGTEMRTAVLELAFRGLGAELACSGYVDGNDASRRVSEKLGYAVAGRAERAPRGEPVGETEVELHREDWRPPVPVEIVGLEPALPLFGVLRE